MSPQFIIRHPQAEQHQFYTTEAAAITAAERLVTNHGGDAWIYQRVALVEATSAVTR